MSAPSSDLAESGQIQVFRLYVTGSTPQSSRAIGNMKAICERYLKNRHSLTVIDLYNDKNRGEEDQIVVSPTLVRTSPQPVKRIIGDLSDTARVMLALGIAEDQKEPLHEA